MTHLLGLALAAGLAAQAPAANTPDRVTVTGCVERADQVAPTGTLGTTVDSLDFVLIASNDNPSPAATGTAGTSGSTPGEPTTPAAGPMYKLDAETGKLNPHVGHKVEVSGTLEKAADVSGSPATDPLAAARTLKVDSVKMLAATCPRQ